VSVIINYYSSVAYSLSC